MISIKKTIKFLAVYFIFSAVVYFGSYALLSNEHSLLEKKSEAFFSKMVNALVEADLRLAMEDLKARSHLFFIYWPRALQYALRLILS